MNHLENLCRSGERSKTVYFVPLPKEGYTDLDRRKKEYRESELVMLWYCRIITPETVHSYIYLNINNNIPISLHRV